MSKLERDYSFGGWLRTFRLKQKVTLRSAAIRFGMDPGNLSKLERSELDPPKDAAKVRAIVTLLGLGKHEFELLKSLAFQHHVSKLRSDFDDQP